MDAYDSESEKSARYLKSKAERAVRDGRSEVDLNERMLIAAIYECTACLVLALDRIELQLPDPGEE